MSFSYFSFYIAVSIAIAEDFLCFFFSAFEDTILHFKRLAPELFFSFLFSSSVGVLIYFFSIREYNQMRVKNMKIYPYLRESLQCPLGSLHPPQPPRICRNPSQRKMCTVSLLLKCQFNFNLEITNQLLDNYIHLICNKQIL